MASKRLAASAVDWAAFAERVPPSQIEAYRALKAKSDMFVSRVHRFPEKPPAINWESYKKTLANPAIVDQFKKQYEAVNVSYPADNKNVKAGVDDQEKQAQTISKQFVEETQKEIKNLQLLLEKIKNLPKWEEYTMESYGDYFPSDVIHYKEPSFWPHSARHQPPEFGGTHKVIPAGHMSLGKYAY